MIVIWTHPLFVLSPLPSSNFTTTVSCSFLKISYGWYLRVAFAYYAMETMEWSKSLLFGRTFFFFWLRTSWHSTFLFYLYYGWWPSSSWLFCLLLLYGRGCFRLTPTKSGHKVISILPAAGEKKWRMLEKCTLFLSKMYTLCTLNMKNIFSISST